MKKNIVWALAVVGFSELVNSADVDPAYAKNITIYHVNPSTFGVAPINMDTGDALGDAYFDLRGVVTPLECAHPSPATAHDCDNAEVTSNDLVITKLVLTVDSRFGEYGRCNICVNGTDHHGNNNCTDGEYVCSCGGYSQPTPCPASVGFENISAKHAYGDCRDHDPEWECFRQNVAKRTGGFWYSTFKDGYCGDSDASDTYCKWKIARVVKRINKTCSDDSIYSNVEAYAAHGNSTDCFSAENCATGNGNRNTSSSCWINCFFTTTLGATSARPGYDPTTAGGMSARDIMLAWDAPFASEDPLKGGCPSIPVDEDL